MKKKNLALIHYKVPFRKPFKTATGDIMEREGFIIGDDHGIWSEIAPLPGFSIEKSGDVSEFLMDHAGEIRAAFRDHTLDRFLRSEHYLSDLSRLPSVRFGLSMLSEQQKAVAAGQPLRFFWKRTLFKKKSRNQGVATEGYVRCNALAGLMEPDKLHQIIHFRRACGYQTIKLKVPSDPDAAFEIIHTTCRTYPDLLFRFDMNRSFQLNQARELFRKIQSVCEKEDLTKNIAYIEEPLVDPSPESLSELRAFGFPLAVDESVRTPEDVPSLQEDESVTHLVVKPMLFGSFEELQVPLQSKLTVAVSSAFETAIGRRLLAHIAALSNIKRETDHGLDTGYLLQWDFPPRESGPYIHLGQTSGLGFQPDMQQNWLTPVRNF